jgi:predicted lysophospholipase L1 biosynthesis ABC-type transport system permease subunit
MVKIYSLEFAVPGAVSGAIGAALGIALNGLILTLMFHRPQLPVSWTPIAGSLLLTPVLTLAAAWLPLARLLQRKPFALLRQDCP